MPFFKRVRLAALAVGIGVASGAHGDWIATRPSALSWEIFARSLPERAELRRVFGPGGRFALVSGSLPARVPDGFAGQPNYLYRALDATDPEIDRSWGLINRGQADGYGQPGIEHRDVGAAVAWERLPAARDIPVAVLDSGVDLTHEELRDRLWRNTEEIAGNGIDDDGNGLVDDTMGWDFGENDAVAQDDYGHGTLVAGLIGARAGNGAGSRGLAPNSRLLILKCLDASGFGTTEAAIRAIHYAIEKGARVLNLSWGGTRYDPALYETLRWAGTRGALAVVAAGNSGESNDESKAPIYPASFPLPNVISVAAYDNRDNLWSLSNWGKRTVHVGAPGVAIFGPWKGGGYAVRDGTSFAAPHVSAVAAMVLGLFPDLALAPLRERLLQTSEVIRYYEKERTLTAGRIHAANALVDKRPARPMAPSSWERRGEALETAHPYPNDATLSFSVREPGATHVKIRFKGFKTESCCDIVTLRDGAGTVVARYSGERGDFWSADALGDTLLVELKSDYVTRDWGFEIDSVEFSRAGSPSSRRRPGPR